MLVSLSDTAEDTQPRRTLNKGIALKHLVLREGRGWVIPDYPQITSEELTGLIRIPWTRLISCSQATSPHKNQNATT